jgi:acyl-CoA thioesterase FadM
MPTDPAEMSSGAGSVATGRGASIRIQRRVEWVDTDASTKWHNTAPLEMLEAAETTLLDRLGMLEEIFGRLPRVSIKAHFMRALGFWEKVDVDLEVAALGRTSITYRGNIRRGDDVVVSGEVVAVFVDESGRPCPWSERQRSLLGSSGAQLPELLTDG